MTLASGPACWRSGRIPSTQTGRKAAKKLDLVLYDEVMVSWGAGVSHWFNQNRVYAGLAWQLGDAFTVEGGYLNSFQQRSSGGRFWNRSIFRLSLIHNWKLGKSGESR